MLPVGQEKVDHLKHTDGGVVNGEEDHQVPSIHFAQGKLLISHFTVVILVLLALSLTTINLYCLGFMSYRIIIIFVDTVIIHYTQNVFVTVADNNYVFSDLHNLLLTQQEDIQFLRSKLLSEYESMLQHRTEVMQNQSSQVSVLEEQMLQLEKQYGEELRSKQETVLCKNGNIMVLIVVNLSCIMSFAECRSLQPVGIHLPIPLSHAFYCLG